MTSAANPEIDTWFRDLSTAVPVRKPAKLKILFLADDRHPANVVQDHIAALSWGREQQIFVVNPIHAGLPDWSFSRKIDLILIHYSIFILGEYFLPPHWREFVRTFPGPKAQIIQDEHRHIRRMRQRMADLGIKAVFSSLEVGNLKKVYDGPDVSGVTFYSCLPGYVAADFKTWSPPPIAERPLDIVYRGRDLPFKLGRMGQEKRAIGEKMQAISQIYGLKTDIDSTEDSRIYGQSWSQFLMSGRATLGVEGGASIFDFDDNIEPAIDAFVGNNPQAKFEDVWSAVLSPYEGNVVHRTITPKLLEAICAKTALILYPGRYRGLLEAGRHYIALERDGSNAEDVVRRIRDAPFLQALVDRAYADILANKTLSMDFYATHVLTALSGLYRRSLAGTGRLLRRWQILRWARSFIPKDPEP